MIRRTPIKRTRIKATPKARARKNLVSECDQLVRALIMDRDGHKCVKCGAGPEAVLQASHLFSKGPYSRLRFELLNVVAMCLKCHLFWWHKSPIDAHEWLERKYPGRIELLQRLAATAAKVDLKLLVICLRAEVRGLGIEG